VKRLRVAFAVSVALAACGKGKAPDAVVPASSASSVATALSIAGEAAVDAGGAMDAREASQWAAARDGEPEELMRLADLVGCEGLRERAEESSELLPTAAMAMQYCPDFSELPFLAREGTTAVDAVARAALESAGALAARPRRSVDPEDADELHAGCAALLALARSPDRPRERRVLAVRALRMLSEYGCVKRADIPVELDAH
jgi:hypothetical protein